MTDRTVAIVIPTLSWSWTKDETVPITPEHPRKAVGMEALDWQGFSANAASVEMDAYPSPMRRVRRANGVESVIEPRTGTAPRGQNRLLEIQGLMGAIGEQLAMAWAAEQDAQRVIATGEHRDELTNRLLLRTQSELAGHFILGATHSLANLILRILLLNTAAAKHLQGAYKGETFPPGSDERDAWPTFGVTMARKLRRAAKASGNAGMIELADVVSTLRTSMGWSNLDGRRGMDYHRRRPQSVPHTAPREGTVSSENGTTMMKMVGPKLEADADGAVVHAVAVEALDALAGSMRMVRLALPETIRAEGINYSFEASP